jgi:hypothetical protein
MENENSISSILVWPRSLNNYRYYLNGNLSNPHSLSREKIYYFICNFIKPPITLTVLEHIDKRLPFLVLPIKNEFLALSLDVAEEIAAITSSMTSRCYREAIQDMNKEKVQRQFDFFIQDSNLKQTIGNTDFLYNWSPEVRDEQSSK